MKKIFWLICFVIMVAGVSNVSAATLTVCESGCDFTTIQAAHDAALTNDIIDIQTTSLFASSTYISKDLTIQGQGQTSTIVSGSCPSGWWGLSIFTISSGTTVTLQDMTIRNGAHGVTNNGTLTLNRVSFLDNYLLFEYVEDFHTETNGDTDSERKRDVGDWKSTDEDYDDGGAGVFNLGNLYCNDCLFQNNRINCEYCIMTGVELVEGAALRNEGYADITNTQFVQNGILSGFSGRTGGGAIYTTGTLSLFQCILSVSVWGTFFVTFFHIP
ncbi:hypothetical protein JXQ70_15760, partial [bacterium]|nr:hypothetical protein [bacterium]